MKGKCLKWEPSVTDLPSACTPDSHIPHICVQLGMTHIGVNFQRLFFMLDKLI